MTLSTRVSLKWGADEAEELTSTYVFTSPKDHFVDVRIYKNEYPHIQSGEQPAPFDQIFQWVIVGDEEEIKGTNRIRFNHSINSQEILKSIATKKPLSECRSAPDVGEFWPIEGSEDRKETGAMVNPDTGVETDYVEIWRSLNPKCHTEEKEVREGYDEAGNKQEPGREVALVFDLEADGLLGRVIRLGSWAQGIIYDANDAVHPLSIMRSHLAEGTWVPMIKYGKHDFTEAYKGGELEKGTKWRRVEDNRKITSKF